MSGMSDDLVKIVSLFPTPVGRFELGRKFTEAELRFINDEPMRESIGNLTSVNESVLDQPEMAELRVFVELNLNRYFNAIYEPTKDLRIRITQSWLNVTMPNGWHHQHEHSNSFISGVLYIKADRAKDKINFFKNQYQQICLRPEKFNHYNSDSWWLDVGAGDLLLFPSRLSHAVPKVKEGDRISLSFNTFPVGWIGDKYVLTHLELADPKEK